MTTRREAIIHALKDTLRITLIEEFGEILSARITEENMASTADAILAVRLDETADRIKEVVDEAGQEGAAAGWKPCSGCYETEDGHPVGEYRHSKQFGCAVGGGCDECGGLGVVWEYHSASDLAWLERQLTEPDPSSLDEAAIRKDEREKCAKICKDYAQWAESKIDSETSIFGTVSNTADDLAEMILSHASAIRNGGKQP